jgi:hypothetical protein
MASITVDPPVAQSTPVELCESDACLKDRPFERALVLYNCLNAVCSAYPARFSDTLAPVKAAVDRLRGVVTGESSAIAVFGHTHAGKSFFINALFGEPILLPADNPDESTTHVPVIVRRDDSRADPSTGTPGFTVTYHFRTPMQFAAALAMAAHRLLFPATWKTATPVASAPGFENALLEDLPLEIEEVWQLELERPSLELQLLPEKLGSMLVDVLGPDWKQLLEARPLASIILDIAGKFEPRDTRLVMCDSPRGVHDEIHRHVLREADGLPLAERCLLSRILVCGPFEAKADLIADGMSVMDMPGAGDGDFLSYLSISECLMQAHRAVFVTRDQSSLDTPVVKNMLKFVRLHAKPCVLSNLVVVCTFFGPQLPHGCGANPNDAKLLERLYASYRKEIPSLKRDNVVCVNSLLSLLCLQEYDSSAFPESVNEQIYQPLDVVHTKVTGSMRERLARLSGIGATLSSTFVEDVSVAIRSCLTVLSRSPVFSSLVLRAPNFMKPTSQRNATSGER